jgi:hypothetical protein
VLDHSGPCSHARSRMPGSDGATPRPSRIVAALAPRRGLSIEVVALAPAPKALELSSDAYPKALGLGGR